MTPHQAPRHQDRATGAKQRPPALFQSIDSVLSFLGLRSSTTIETATDAAPQDRVQATLVCIDLEAWEHDQKVVTEIGIATIDTRHLYAPRGDLSDTAASSEVGDQSVNNDLLSHIRAIHLIIAETAHLVNKQFVKGCPDRFHHGQSMTLPKQDCVALVRCLLRDPSSAVDHSPLAPSPLVPSTSPSPLILVGHGLSSDKAYLSTLSIGPTTFTTLAEIDTQRLCSPRKKPAGLRGLLSALDLSTEDLHNAGNDAVGTLQALLRMVHLRAHGGQGAFNAAVERTRAKAMPRGGDAGGHRAKRKRMTAASLTVGQDPIALVAAPVGDPEAAAKRQSDSTDVAT